MSKCNCQCVLPGYHARTCHLYVPMAVPAPCSEESPAQILQQFEKLIERAPGEVALLIRHGDRIIIRDNSGVTGLTGESLMDKSIALLDELFPPNAQPNGGAEKL